MADREYKIKIITDAAQGVAGAQATAQALDQAGGATETLGKKTEEATKHVDKHVLSHKQLHKIVHALNGVVPLLGTLLQAAFSPIAATVAIAVMAMELFKEKLKAANEELDKMGEEAAKPFGDLRGALEAAERELEKSKDSMTQWTKALGGGFDSAIKHCDAMIAKLHEETSAVQELAAAEKDRAIANLKLQEEMQGGPTPATIAKRANIEGGFETATAARQIDALRQEAGILKAALAGARERQLAGTEAANEPSPLDDKPFVTRHNALKSEIEAADEGKKKALQESAKAGEELEKAREVADRVREMAQYHPFQEGAYVPAYEKEKEAKSKYDAIQSAIVLPDKLREEQKRVDEQYTSETNYRERLKKAAEAAATQVLTLTAKLEALNIKIDTLEKYGPQTEAAKAGARAAGTKSAGLQFSDEVAAHMASGDYAWLAQHGLPMSKSGEKAALQARLIRDFTNAHGELANSFEKLFEALAGTTGDLKEIKRKIDVLEQRAASGK